ncbi:MAG: hypothetical protein K1X55_16075 [Chitinophagales bacterium]|nr:hypothetical protein [Chitinophagales bacterium]
MKKMTLFILSIFILGCKVTKENIVTNPIKFVPNICNVIIDYQEKDFLKDEGVLIIFCENYDIINNNSSFILTKIFTKAEFDSINPEYFTKIEKKDILVKCGIGELISDNLTHTQLRENLNDKVGLQHPMVWRIIASNNSVTVEKQNVTIVPIRKIDFIPPK